MNVELNQNASCSSPMSPKAQVSSSVHNNNTSSFSLRISITVLVVAVLSPILYQLLRHTQFVTDMSQHRNSLLDASRYDYPGDNILPDAVMIYDQTIFIPDATPAEIFPWLLQLGAQRAGWYLPFWLEDRLAERMRASRVLESQWTNLSIGQRVPDFQLPFFDKEVPTFELVGLCNPSSTSESMSSGSEGDKEHYAVWKSERYGCEFTWTQMTRLATSDLLQQSSTGGSIVHLRFRGVMQAQGLKRTLVVWGGEKMDWASTQPMLAGLRDRVLMVQKQR